MKQNIKADTAQTLFSEIMDTLASLNGWGSVEIYVQDNRVTQITGRRIKKINHLIMKGS